MSKNEFNNGDLVHITGYEYKRSNGIGYDRFIPALDREHVEYTIKVDPTRIYEIETTRVMPLILDNDGTVFYPLKDFNRPHTTKMYVSGEYLSRAESDWDAEDDRPEDDPDDDFEGDEDELDEDAGESDEGELHVLETDPDPEGAADWKETQEFAKISRNISIITEALAEVTESLTTILKNRMAR